jgi:hypothetical protein
MRESGHWCGLGEIQFDARVAASTAGGDGMDDLPSHVSGSTNQVGKKAGISDVPCTSPTHTTRVAGHGSGTIAAAERQVKHTVAKTNQEMRSKF